MNPKHNLKHDLKWMEEQKGVEPGKLDGWDSDLFDLITRLFTYAESLEERVEKLEEKK